MKERTVLSLKLLSTHIILLPTLLLVSFLINRDLYILLTISQTLLIILFFSGYWEFLGLRFRVLYSCLIQTLILILFYYKISLPFSLSPNIFLVIFLCILQIILLSELIKILIVILRYENNSLEITFPLKNGLYLITDGGNSKISRLMNYHFYSPVHKKNRTNNSMKFATDIVKIDQSIKKFMPLNNEDYPIFGEKVFCPINGTVIKVVNNIDDNIPYSGNYPYNTGNTLIIKDSNYYFLIGHLKKGSIRINTGDYVHQNDLLAEVGNSGYSERPHVHMQLIFSQTENIWTGHGTNISFQNNNLFKNRKIKT
jgi:hypothetical protein